MLCTTCGKEFVSRRKDARFCSVTCRSKCHRATDKPATDIIATDNIINRVDSLGRKCLQTDDGIWIDQNGTKMCAEPGCIYTIPNFTARLCSKHESRLPPTPAKSIFADPRTDKK
jgi:hypothetical protein